MVSIPSGPVISSSVIYLVRVGLKFCSTVAGFFKIDPIFVKTYFRTSAVQHQFLTKYRTFRSVFVAEFGVTLFYGILLGPK
jgi:hypothetical protein